MYERCYTFTVDYYSDELRTYERAEKRENCDKVKKQIENLLHGETDHIAIHLYDEFNGCLEADEFVIFKPALKTLSIGKIYQVDEDEQED